MSVETHGFDDFGLPPLAGYTVRVTIGPEADLEFEEEFGVFGDVPWGPNRPWVHRLSGYLLGRGDVNQYVQDEYDVPAEVLTQLEADARQQAESRGFESEGDYEDFIHDFIADALEDPDTLRSLMPGIKLLWSPVPMRFSADGGKHEITAHIERQNATVELFGYEVLAGPDELGQVADANRKASCFFFPEHMPSPFAEDGTVIPRNEDGTDPISVMVNHYTLSEGVACGQIGVWQAEVQIVKGQGDAEEIVAEDSFTYTDIGESKLFDMIKENVVDLYGTLTTTRTIERDGDGTLHVGVKTDWFVILEAWNAFGFRDAQENMAILGGDFDEWEGPSTERWQQLRSCGFDPYGNWLPDDDYIPAVWTEDDWQEVFDSYKAGWVRGVNAR